MMVIQMRNKGSETTMRFVYLLRPEIEVSEELAPKDVALARIPGYWRFRRCAA